MPKSSYADTYWEPDDVIEAANMQDVTLTQEQAHRWWEINEKMFLSAILNFGSEILDDVDWQRFAKEGAKK